MNCKATQIKISALMDGQLAERDAQRVHEHIRSCQQCKAVYQSFVQLQETIHTRIENKPAPAYIADRLQQRIMADIRVHTRPSAIEMLIAWLRERLTGRVRTQLMQVAGAFALAAVAGVIFFRLALYDKISDSTTPMDLPTLQVALTEKELPKKVNDFLDKSSVVLLQIKNAQARNPELYSEEQQLARQLLTQSRLVSQEIRDTEFGYLQQLVNDLEPVFIDIANLKHQDNQSMGIIQEAIRKNDYLLKIEFARTKQR